MSGMFGQEKHWSIRKVAIFHNAGPDARWKIHCIECWLSYAFVSETLLAALERGRVVNTICNS